MGPGLPYRLIIQKLTEVLPAELHVFDHAPAH